MPSNVPRNCCKLQPKISKYVEIYKEKLYNMEVYHKW